MNKNHSQALIAREKRSYLFASLCSVIAALAMFYKLFQNDLYLKLIDYVWLAIVVGMLILGNVIHGFFAFKSFNSLDKNSDLNEIKKVKGIYYKSLVVNFLSPYMVLIIFFISITEYYVAMIAFILFIMMVLGCYFLDLKPTMKLK